jgi:hypothetical protein
MSETPKLSKLGLNIGDLKQQLDPDPIIRKLKRDKEELEAKVNQLKLQLGGEEDFFSELKQCVKKLPCKDITYKIPKSTKVTNPLSVVTTWSDWHIGECIEKDEVEGVNEFNFKIATARVEFLVTKLLDWVDSNRTISVIDEIVIICIGDMISGDIHEELKITNEFPTPIQCVNSANLISNAISAISEKFPSVRVEYIVPDNHSRLSKKYQYKQGGLNSLNYIVGTIAKLRLERQSNVKFNIYTCDKAVINVRGFQYLCCHGKDIKGWAGFPYYGIDRVTAREAKARMFNPEKEFHKLVIGHFHAPLNSPNWIINGSLTGTTELDHAYGRYAQPCQIAWFVHPKFGEWSWNCFWLQFAPQPES